VWGGSIESEAGLMMRFIWNKIVWIIDAINPLGDRLWNALGVGGLDLADYIKAVEQHYSIIIAKGTAEQVVTLGDLCDCVANLSPKSSAEEIWTWIRQMSSEYFGIDGSELSQDTRFIEYLGV